MAEGEVYISHFFSDTRFIRGGKVDWDAPGWREIKEKRRPSQAALPLSVFAGEKRETFQNLPAAFTAGGGGLNVSKKLAEVLQRHDLGEGGVVPTKLYQFEQTSPVDGDFYMVMLFLFEKKVTLMPRESRNIKPMMYEPDPPTRWMTLGVSDGDVAVSASAQGGVDMWFDPTLPIMLFMSGRLVDALTQAGFADVFNPIKCRVVPFH